VNGTGAAQRNAATKLCAFEIHFVTDDPEKRSVIRASRANCGAVKGEIGHGSPPVRFFALQSSVIHRRGESRSPTQAEPERPKLPGSKVPIGSIFRVRSPVNMILLDRLA
jgi:hypothetical protein